jgi:hypothetical protein
MLNFCGIVAAILKMATGRNFSMSGINSGHHNLPTYEIGQCWICAVLWWPFWKWRPVEIFLCRESIRDIIIYPHIKFWWYRTMLNCYRHFLCRVLNSTLSDFNAISYVGRLWCPELIPDIEKFLPVAIFKMATTIPHKFNIFRFQRHFICG